jgi:hypothetical protein
LIASGDSRIARVSSNDSRIALVANKKIEHLLKIGKLSDINHIIMSID